MPFKNFTVENIKADVRDYWDSLDGSANIISEVLMLIALALTWGCGGIEMLAFIIQLSIFAYVIPFVIRHKRLPFMKNKIAFLK